MATNDAFQPEKTAHRILQDHRDLQALTGEICASTDLLELLPQLDRLRAELEQHFRMEEAPGGFGTVVSESAPHKASAIDHLFAEHGEFLFALAALRESVEQCLEGPIAQVRESAALFCSQLAQHEEKEHELLGEAMYTDIGGG